MQKYKPLLEVIFLILGTCLVIFVGTIMIRNIVIDSRLLGNNEPVQVVETLKNVDEFVETKKEEFQTLKFERARIEEAAKKPTAKATATVTPKTKTTSTTNIDRPRRKPKIAIEIINCSGFPKLGEHFKEMFKNEGFIAVTVSGGARRVDETKIIERNTSKEGQLIKNIIKMGRISRSIREEYPYNITLVIGEDVTP